MSTQPPSETPTPRTDKRWNDIKSFCSPSASQEDILRWTKDFSNQLEKELQEAKRDFQQAEEARVVNLGLYHRGLKEVAQLTTELDLLKLANGEMRGAKEKSIKLGTFGILERHGRVLLGRRNPDDTSFPNCWCHPGGGVEYSEPINLALRREFLEEVQIQVAVAETYLAIHEYFENDRHVVLVFKEVICEDEPLPGDGFTEIGWFTLDQIRGLAHGGATTPLTLIAAENWNLHRYATPATQPSPSIPMNEPTEIAKKCAQQINFIAQENEDRLSDGVLEKIIQKSINESLAELESEHDEEIGEFQNNVKNLIDERTGSNVDGAGCDSGDWRDFTLCEISQGLACTIPRDVAEKMYEALRISANESFVEHKKDSDYLRCPVCIALSLAEKHGLGKRST